MRFEFSFVAKSAGGSLFGLDVIRRSNLPDSGWVPDPNSLQVDPPIDAAIYQPNLHGRHDIVSFARDRVAAELTAVGAPSYGLVLLPGFDSTFVASMSRAAQVMDSYRAADVFCSSWPSQGKFDLPSYKADRDAAMKSANAIADSLRKLFAVLTQLKANLPVLHIVAHSMGNYALRHAVQLIPAKERNKRLFESAFLMAADENYDSLSKAKELSPLITLAKKVPVYKDGGDLALSASNVINNYPRLGAWGPRDLRKLPATVTSVDCSDVGSTQGDNGETHYGHQYYRLSQWVIKDVKQVLAGISPDQIEARLAAIPDNEGGRAWWIANKKSTPPIQGEARLVSSSGDQFVEIQVWKRTAPPLRCSSPCCRGFSFAEIEITNSRMSAKQSDRENQ